MHESPQRQHQHQEHEQQQREQQSHKQQPQPEQLPQYATGMPAADAREQQPPVDYIAAAPPAADGMEF